VIACPQTYHQLGAANLYTPQWPAPKDPADIKDYDVDWIDRLAEGEELFSATWSIVTMPADDAGNPLEILPDTGFSSAGVARVWLGGGVPGGYNLLCRVTTSQARNFDQTMRVIVAER
jgi:hypothetical protein